jgi:membrane protease YdiL (CAAX protease family)
MSESETSSPGPLVCNACGGPLTVAPGADLLTCDHCQTHLAIRRDAVPVGVAVDEDPPLLDDVEFLESEEPAVSRRPPGPGLPESLLWVIGIFAFQIGAGAVGAIVFAIGSMITEPAGSPAEVLNRIEGLSPNGTLLFFGLPNLFVFLALIGLGCWRLGRPPTHKLNFSLPSYTQLAILASAVFPLGLIADALWKPAQAAWQSFVEQVPWLRFMDETNIMDFMDRINGASLPLLLFFLAVVPAVGEEFMLRGLIGRGLVARWGILWGVLMTSVLFAGLHMYPPHVAAIFPVGIMMHIVYLTTRSFWTPMLFHFMNNGLAALYSALGVTSDSGEVADGAVTEWEWLKYAAPPYVLLCCWLLWRYRTEYVDDAGTPVWPGYHTTEQPDPCLPVRRSARNSIPIALAFGLLIVGQLGLVAHDIHTELRATPAADEPETAAVVHATSTMPVRRT